MLECYVCNGEGFFESPCGRIKLCTYCDGTGVDPSRHADLFEPEDFARPFPPLSSASGRSPAEIAGRRSRHNHGR